MRRMALSDYEQRILHEIEIELGRPRHPRTARCGGALRTYWPALLICLVAAAIIAVLAVFSTGAGAAVPAGVVGACAGYAVARQVCRR